tara:strand:+ start:77 stop:223 length:147 start_codon:yes stop_codon:yes gene_type:complete
MEGEKEERRVSSFHLEKFIKRQKMLDHENIHKKVTKFIVDGKLRHVLQ